jgi:hypothetical protein
LTKLTSRELLIVWSQKKMQCLNLSSLNLTVKHNFRTIPNQWLSQIRQMPINQQPQRNQQRNHLSKIITSLKLHLKLVMFLRRAILNAS